MLPCFLLKQNKHAPSTGMRTLETGGEETCLLSQSYWLARRQTRSKHCKCKCEGADRGPGEGQTEGLGRLFIGQAAWIPLRELIWFHPAQFSEGINV